MCVGRNPQTFAATSKNRGWELRKITPRNQKINRNYPGL